MACLFCRIVTKEIPCHRIMETDRSLAFLDINPLSKGHALVIPKECKRLMHELSDASLADLLPVAKKVALALGGEPYNILQNNGREAHQEVNHVHFHIIPKTSRESGLVMKWEQMAKVDNDELAKYAEELRSRYMKFEDVKESLRQRWANMLTNRKMEVSEEESAVTCENMSSAEFARACNIQVLPDELIDSQSTVKSNIFNSININDGSTMSSCVSGKSDRVAIFDMSIYIPPSPQELCKRSNSASALETSKFPTGLTSSVHTCPLPSKYKRPTIIKRPVIVNAGRFTVTKLSKVDAPESPMSPSRFTIQRDFPEKAGSPSGDSAIAEIMLESR
ncbi:MAG: hypothetical protein SGCHY_001097 [Lobulomycetales sp.]